MGLLAMLAIPAVYLLWRRAPITELTALGKGLVAIAGVAVGIGALVFCSLKSVPGSSLERLTYLRQTQHKRWLREIFLASAVLGLISAVMGYAFMGHLVRALPAQKYSSFRARVIERSLDDSDPFHCKDGLEVQTEDAARYSLCLERGTWWTSVPEHLKRLKAGDFVIVNVRRTALGSAADIAEVAVPGQNFYVE